jgi:hypothetical protein
MKLKYSVIALGLGIACSALPAMADSSTATVDTTGTYNTVNIEQVHAAGASALVIQNGSHNSAGRAPGDPDVEGIQQYNTNSLAEIRQSGTYNDSQILQDHGANDKGYVTQVGNYNFGDIKQVNAYNSQANIYQNGNHNDADINQTGTGLVGRVEQRGNWNEAALEQLGMNNYASATQRGDYNTAEVEQEAGSFHNAAYITQIGTGWSDATRNVANITQGSHNHTAAIYQNGYGNLAVINQH